MSDFMMKQAGENDVALIRKIENTCFFDPWGEDTVRLMLKSPFVKVFYSVDSNDGVTPVSYLVIGQSDCVEIMKIAVMPSYRRQNFGTECLRYAVLAARATPESRIILEVRASNYGAISFYEKNGFIRDGIRKNYYKNPTDDAILMSLQLNETEGR